MAVSYSNLRNTSETERRRLLHQRMLIVNGVFAFIVILIAARLIELQLVRGAEFQARAQQQQFGEVNLPAKRGEILGINSKTGEETIFATNITLDLAYVDPVSVDNPTVVANTLAETLLTPEFHANCTAGSPACPRELQTFYAAAFDPIRQKKIRESGAILEPLPVNGSLPATLLKLPNIVQARDAFAQNIEERIAEKSVTFVPLKYGATRVEMHAVSSLEIPGVNVKEEENLIYANPQEINQSLLESFSQKLGKTLRMDPKDVRSLLRARSLRYVPIMRKLPIALSRKLLQLKTASAKEALAKAEQDAKAKRKKGSTEMRYPLQGIALIPEHWRFYPDTTVASHVVGFLNVNQEPQYGVERTFNPQLRGQKGTIRTVSDPHGGQIFRAELEIDDPRDGDTVVLTLDRAIQKKLEDLMQSAVERFRADSAQAIVMDPQTGRILAMVNAPLFDSNNYAEVYEKEPIVLDAGARKKLVAEIFHPETNALVVRALRDEVFPPLAGSGSGSGLSTLPEKARKALEDIEKLYDLHDLARYYHYIGQTIRWEVFPTEDPSVWLKYRNNIGIGAYLNRTIQEIYEPGSVMKAITMAIAIDQGEEHPTDTYDDTGYVEVDKYKIDNNDHKHYGRVTMINCLEYSINTCMTSISFKLGAKLFQGALTRFGFGQITGIELEDELPGVLEPWREWARSELATRSFGQGISATPLQVIAAWAALANGGRLLRPTIIDRVIHADGTEEKHEPRVVDQVITPETSETITAMLVSSATKGFARAGKPNGYRIAGKTGTSQIAGPGGRYETGTGSTFATYAGYGPADHPRFLVLVKIDRPKNSIHGATAAAPIFKDIATFLFQYYDIPPDGRKE